MQETGVRSLGLRSPRGRHGTPLQYSCLENLMDREAWWATVLGVTKSQTLLSDWYFFLFHSWDLLLHELQRNELHGASCVYSRNILYYLEALSLSRDLENHQVSSLDFIPTAGLPWWLSSKNLPANIRDMGSIFGSERSPGEGNGNLLQYSCLGNPMDKRSLAGYSPWGHKRVGHHLETKQQQYIHNYCNHILPLD